jgi:hypothetical protein
MVMLMLLNKINECYDAMDKVSRGILWAGLALISLMYLTVIVLFLAPELFFPDYDTALCFIGILLESAKEVSGAAIVPVLLYETLSRLIFRTRQQ